MTLINNEMLWRQFAIAMDMPGDALRDCPDRLWEAQLLMFLGQQGVQRA